MPPDAVPPREPGPHELSPDRLGESVPEPPPATAPESSGDTGLESAYDLLQRAAALMRRHHNAQAAVLLERAARLEPGKGSILEALGRACFNAGQLERAKEAFEAHLQVDPSSPYGHYALGQSLKRLGRTREAWTQLRLAVALAPESPLYRAALDRVPAPEGRGAP